MNKTTPVDSEKNWIKQNRWIGLMCARLFGQLCNCDILFGNVNNEDTFDVWSFDAFDTCYDVLGGRQRKFCVRSMLILNWSSDAKGRSLILALRGRNQRQKCIHSIHSMLILNWSSGTTDTFDTVSQRKYVYFWRSLREMWPSSHYLDSRRWYMVDFLANETLICLGFQWWDA